MVELRRYAGPKSSLTADCRTQEKVNSIGRGEEREGGIGGGGGGWGGGG
jgi:hypothetical protein